MQKNLFLFKPPCKYAGFCIFEDLQWHPVLFGPVLFGPLFKINVGGRRPENCPRPWAELLDHLQYCWHPLHTHTHRENSYATSATAHTHRHSLNSYATSATAHTQTQLEQLHSISYFMSVCVCGRVLVSVSVCPCRTGRRFLHKAKQTLCRVIFFLF